MKLTTLSGSALGVLTLTFSLCSISHAATFSESGGLVFFEAEAGNPYGDWTVGTEQNHFSGDGYIEWTGPDLFDVGFAGRDVLTYEIEIFSAGNYEFRWRTRIAKGDSNTESNDSWVRFPSGVNVAGEQPMNGWTKVYMGHFGAWFWDAKMVDHVGANVRQYFAAGTHVVEVAGRSNGHAIDKMALFKYEERALLPSDLDALTGTPDASVTGNQQDIDAESGETEPVTDNTAPATTEAVSVIASGVNHAPGECVAGSLALAPLADIHLQDTQVFNAEKLQIAPEPMRAVFRFDLSAVSGMTSAALEFHQFGSADATVEFQRVQTGDWTEDSGPLAATPQNILMLQSDTINWAPDTRYSVVLPAVDLPSEMVEISVDANAADQLLELASREDSLNMPLLVLSGEGDFCQNYQAALASAGGGEPTESESSGGGESVDEDESNGIVETGSETGDNAVDTGENDVDDSDAVGADASESATETDPDSNTEEATTQSTSSGGGALGFWSLLMLLGLRGRRLRVR